MALSGVCSAKSVVPYLNVITDSSLVLNGGVNRSFTNRFLIDSGIAYTNDTHTLFASVQWQQGSDGSKAVGDIQVYSNIDAQNFSRIYEAYYRYDADNWYLVLGRTDANSTFAAPEHATEFINSSMGFSPTIFALPTYPTPAFGVLMAKQLNESLRMSAGIYDAADNDFTEQFYIGEIAYQLDEDNQIKLGYWYDTTAAASFNAKQLYKAGRGLYAITDSEFNIGSQSIQSYLQLAYSDPLYSEIEWHLGIGANIHSPFNQTNHIAGVAVTSIKLSDYLTTQAPHETAFEAFYKAQLTSTIAVKPDLQWILNPSGRRDIHDALVFTLRLELSFN
ncbi:carbohydrate porin [Alteromonas gilva]|uniref:Carbohydrate porin n=1 Tax=Alteromonas gilva TaxID=2987522 RepID=A0ABT5L258_9ALTE|nr:carbohydrate porin [Alteromonas gilva]MDC8831120.1 carbohydrate porin [Alteromonas gilva]